MSEQEFIIEIKKLPIEFSEEKIRLVFEYFNILINYNEQVNLTSITDREDALLKHFYDSLTPSLVVNFNDINTLLDVGTGAGFPGVVLKIFFPHLKLTLLDSNHKKTDFLILLIEKLKLHDVRIVCDRSENYSFTNKNKFDLVIARAVKSLDLLLELCIPMVKTNGYFISMKGQINEELEENNKVINFLGGKVSNCFQFKLPVELSSRTIILINKINATPKGFPREYSQIIKKPLKIIVK